MVPALKLPPASRTTTVEAVLALVAASVAALPRPRFVRASPAVEAPVPPLAIGNEPLTPLERSTVPLPTRFHVVPALS